MATGTAGSTADEHARRRYSPNPTRSVQKVPVLPLTGLFPFLQASGTKAFGVFSMSPQQRRVVKSTSPAQDAAQAAKHAMEERTDAASLDTFNSLVADRVKHGVDAGAPAVSAVGVAAPTGGAAAAAASRDAAKRRLEPADKEDRTADQPDSTVDTPISLADRLEVNLATDGQPGREDFVGPDAGGEPQTEGFAPFRDSGRESLIAQANGALDAADDTSTGGRTTGRQGTPEDLGITGDVGAKSGLGRDGGGMDLFDVGLPNRGVSGASNDLGIMQSMLPGVGANTGGMPSVANGETLIDQEPIDDDTTQEDTIQVDEFIPQVIEAVEAALPYVVAGGLVVGAAAAIALAPAAAIPAAAAVLITASMEEDETSGTGGPDASSPGREGADTGNAWTAMEGAAFRAAARERLGLGQGGSGDIDPADDGGSGQVPGGPAPTLAATGMQQKAKTEFLIAQPAGPDGAVRGSGSLDLGRLPGDMGNIDYGPDSSSAWTGDGRTEDEAEALNSFGGSGLSISDANRNDEEEEEEDDSDDAI